MAPRAGCWCHDWRRGVPLVKNRRCTDVRNARQAAARPALLWLRRERRATRQVRRSLPSPKTLSGGWLAGQDGVVWGTNRQHGRGVSGKRRWDRRFASTRAWLLRISQSACRLADSHVRSGVGHPNTGVAMPSKRAMSQCRCRVRQTTSLSAFCTRLSTSVSRHITAHTSGSQCWRLRAFRREQRRGGLPCLQQCKD